MIWQRILYLILFSGVSLGSGDTFLTKDEIQKLSIKTLKNMLNERNIQCLGCNEKIHFVEKVYETQHLLPVNQNENKEKNEKKKSNKDSENLEEVLRSLKKSGFGDAKVFTANDFQNMKSQNDLNDLLNRKQQEQQRQQKPSSSKKRRKDDVDIDLDEL
jgi:hypothetical protein